MLRINIEWLLESGATLGFTTLVQDPDYLGWILLNKHKANPRLKELIDKDQNPRVFARQERIERAPYQLLVIELRRDVHEAGGYETESDYRKKESFWFSTLNEVETQLAEWGLKLEDVKDSRELDAP